MRVWSTKEVSPAHGEEPGRGSLCGPEVRDHLSISLDVWSDDEYLKTVGTGFERPCCSGADPYRIELRQIDQLGIELDAFRTGQDDVNLLGFTMPVSEGLALTGLDD